MKQWFCILFLSIVFVANSSAAMLMPIQMLSTAPGSGDAVNKPCHQMVPANVAADQIKTSDSKSSGQHCPNCVKIGHTAIADGCGSCSCFSVGGVLSVSIELMPLSLPSPEYTDNYLIHFTSIPRLPLLRPPQSA